MYRILWLLLLLAFESECRRNSSSKPMDEFLKALNNYDRAEVPDPDHPTEVKVGFYVNSFYGISHKNMEYSMSFYLRQSWTDPRLASVGAGKSLRLPHGSWDDIWTPDLFFRNEKEASYISIIAPQRLLRIHDGEVWYVIKYDATLSCPMSLQKFPFDTQICGIMLESFGYTMDSMYFNWLDTPVEFDIAIRQPEFSLMDINLYDCSQNYTGGAFPCLEARFVLRRDVGYYILQVFSPSIILVVISWTQFWLEPHAMTGRVLVGLFCSFTLVAQMTGLRASLPAISYLTSLDIWMGACLLFTASTLLQMVLVAVCSRRHKKKRGDEFDVITDRLDMAARIVYPLIFAVFSIIYFTLYSYPTPAL